MNKLSEWEIAVTAAVATLPENDRPSVHRLAMVAGRLWATEPVKVITDSYVRAGKDAGACLVGAYLVGAHMDAGGSLSDALQAALEDSNTDVDDATSLGCSIGSLMTGFDFGVDDLVVAIDHTYDAMPFDAGYAMGVAARRIFGAGVS